jgi:hypothetical protein
MTEIIIGKKVKVILSVLRLLIRGDARAVFSSWLNGTLEFVSTLTFVKDQVIHIIHPTSSY